MLNFPDDNNKVRCNWIDMTKKRQFYLVKKVTNSYQNPLPYLHVRGRKNKSTHIKNNYNSKHQINTTTV
jgi:hypothetical protein